MKKKFVMILMVLLLVTTMVALPVNAADIVPLKTYNYHDHSYFGNYASVVNSYLISGNNGTCIRVEKGFYEEDGQYVYIETYGANKEILSQQRLTMELPVFGGFYEGADSYFLVYGQNNPNEDDSLEIMRVVRYSKSWERMASASVFGANTTVPFRAGTLRMIQTGDTLYIRTCHEMYASSDGRNHQANMTYALRISDMSIKSSQYTVMNNSAGYASHSFNQFIDFDGEYLVAADHGDAYPRSVVLFRYRNNNGEVAIGNWNSTTCVDVLPIKGEIGDNYTGVEVGGMAVTDTHYLVAGNSIDQTSDSGTGGVKNIFLTATPKSDFTEEATTLRWFTNFGADTESAVSNPYLIKLSGNDLVLLWEQNELVCYVFLDSTGKATSDILIQRGCLSDCEPIVTKDGLTWYVTYGETITFYTLDTKNRVQKHIYNTAVTEPTCTEEGYTTHTCFICGDSYVDTKKDALGHNMGQWVVTREATCTEEGVRQKNCSRCDHFETEAIDVISHDMGDWVITKAPTITQEGEKVRSCMRGGCEYRETESMPKVEPTNGWYLENGNWVFYENGVKVTNAWRKDSKGWCYLGSDGVMLTNQWLRDSKGWCYIGADGYCETNCWKLDSYGWLYLDGEGSMTKNNWVLTGGKWYFLDAEGYMVTNQWRKDSIGWCYLGGDGAMLTNQWLQDSKGWCYIGANGYCETECWKLDSYGWLYLDSEGSMTKNQWVYTDGAWYYLDGEGYMVTGEYTIAGEVYTFGANGALQGENDTVVETPDPVEPQKCETHDFVHIETQINQEYELYNYVQDYYKCKNCGYTYSEAHIASANVSAATIEREERSAVENVNRLRVSMGLNELWTSDSWDAWADTRAAELAVLYSHGRPDGGLWIYGDGVYYTVAENIAAGQSSGYKFYNAFFNSPQHKGAMLAEEAVGIAVGIYVDERGSTYCAMVLIAAY